MAFTVKSIIRKDFQKKDNTTNILFRVTINRKTKLYKTNYCINPKYWDWKNNKVKFTYPLAIKLNNHLDENQIIIQNAFIDLEKSKKQINFRNFEIFYKTDSDDLDFFHFANEYIKQLEGKMKKDVIRQYKGELTKIKKFQEYISLNDIDYNFLLNYEQYMHVSLNNKVNTVAKTYKRIRALLNIAQNKGLIKKNPFTIYKIKSEPTKREFLIIEELEKLESLYKKPMLVSQHNVLRYFLFGCYSGLRYEDMRQLRFRDVENNTISIKMEKTADYITIPISKKASNQIPENLAGNKDSKVFNVISNQKTNCVLKEIMTVAEIDKNISFHCSRHTFATISLNIGIPIEIIQKLLGHSDIKTTQIYAKLLTKTKEDQMKKWDNF